MNDFNERIIEFIDNPNLLLNFVHAFIFEVITPAIQNNLFYCENLIKGEYEKYNNNSGWN